MKDQALEKLRYPIGKFEWKHEMSKENFEFHKKDSQLSQFIGE